MTESIDHDRLFKELLATFFIEFIELFSRSHQLLEAQVRGLDVESLEILGEA
ncbi:hypothetical protein [Trichormus variabilis]|uniref:Uncharacterized protein n=1 Tax=Trichormus variabilis SAG 1403-4b TaxID=447716 RepID=A0A3S1AC00_ANAVA|nr:hypothetical protein [Trichormus variabilis]MBD2627602.1 hypothetical protein [Trichormus variabilis FACHB-164]RUS97830.1 hypothetical protein DSM107003_17050 [Trichormus variabilis SAG 1403-4b]